MTMFEQASRLGLRFDSPKGQLATEDLWHLPLTSKSSAANLDDIARAIHRQMRDDSNISFVEKQTQSDQIIDLKFNIVKHVIDTRLAEQKVAAEAREKAAKKQRIMAILASKQDAKLESSSVEELEAMMNNM